MEEEIAQVNQAQLLQAHSTLHREHLFQALLGKQLDFEKWEMILQGMVDLIDEGVEEGTHL